MRSVLRFGALLSMVILVAGCVSAGTTPSPTPAATAVPATAVPATPEVPTPTPTVEIPTPTVEPTLTYTDTEAGFALDYPAAWTILPISPEAKDGSFVYSTTLMSWRPVDGGSDGIPAGQTKVDVTLIKSDVASLDDAIAERKTLLGAGEVETSILSEEVLTLASGLPVLRWALTSSFGDSIEYIAAIDGNIVLLSGMGDAAVFDRVAGTLRLWE